MEGGGLGQPRKMSCGMLSKCYRRAPMTAKALILELNQVEVMSGEKSITPVASFFTPSLVEDWGEKKTRANYSNNVYWYALKALWRADLWGIITTNWRLPAVTPTCSGVCFKIKKKGGRRACCWGRWQALLLVPVSYDRQRVSSGRNSTYSRAKAEKKRTS